MAEDVQKDGGAYSYVTLSDEVTQDYIKMFKEGRAIVPIKKVSVPLGYFQRNNKGEPKEVSEAELYKYWKADGTVQQAFSAGADMMIAYGYEFDIPKPTKKPLTEEDESLTHLMDLWRHYIKLDAIKRYSVIAGKIFGNFYAEKVYDKAGGKISKSSWGIKKIKILDPRTIFVDRAGDGKIKMFYQHPRADQLQPRSIIRSNRSIRIPPAQMIHIKFDDIMNKTYGHARLYSMLDTIDMKIGLKADAVAIAQRRGSPFLVWSIGSEDKIFPPTLIQEIRMDLESQLLDVTDNDVFVPGFIKVEVVGGDNDAGVSLIPLIDFMNKEIAIAAGVPDIIFAGSTAAGESAKAKEELWMRQTKALQNFIGDEFRNQVYSDLLFPPEKKKSGNNDIWVSKFDELTPEQYEQIPYSKWHIIESVSDHRLRMGELTNAGLIGESEGRKQLNMRGKLEEEDQVVANRVKLKEVEVKKKQAEQVPMTGKTPTSSPRKAKTTSVNKS